MNLGFRYISIRDHNNQASLSTYFTYSNSGLLYSGVLSSDLLAVSSSICGSVLTGWYLAIAFFNRFSSLLYGIS
jgi:hypothetical protein